MPETEILGFRDDSQARPDIDTRECLIRAATLDEKARSVEIVLATEQPTVVLDRVRWEPILEVLRMDGVQLPSPNQIPLLPDHFRFSSHSVLGSIFGLRVQGDELIGRETWASDLGPEDERLWNKTKEGHLPSRSAGYSVQEATDISPGETAVVKGRTYTAPRNMRMRISTKPPTR